MSASLPPSLRVAVDEEAGALASSVSRLEQDLPSVRRVPLLAAPVVWPKRLEASVARACEGLRRALLRVAGPGRWPAGVPMPEGLAPLIETEPLTTPLLGACRFDAVGDRSGALWFVEVQAGDPSGPGLVDALVKALRESPKLRPWLASTTSLVEARRRWLNETVGTPLARVAFVNDDGCLLEADTELMARHFRAEGVTAQRLDARAFRWNGATLSAHGQAFDVLLRDSHEELTLARDAVDPLWRALEAGLPRLNPFRDVWFDDKTCFALLWAKRHSLPAVEREIVERHVPETRVVEPNFHSRLLAERPAWVLKPTTGFGGYEVTVGAEVDEAQWRLAVARTETRPTVAQRFVPVARETVASFTGPHRAVTWSERFTTLSFWCHGGRFSGAFVRAGDHRVVNVHQGGGLGPLVFVPDE